MSLERTISKLALQFVDEFKARHLQDNEAQADYRSFSQSFPVLLRTAGLNQSLAFLRGKGKDLHTTVYLQYEAHFRELKFIEANANLLDISANSTKLPANQYRLYNRIALQIAFWHKRYAEARLEKRTPKAGS